MYLSPAEVPRVLESPLVALKISTLLGVGQLGQIGDLGNSADLAVRADFCCHRLSSALDALRVRVRGELGLKMPYATEEASRGAELQEAPGIW